MWGLMLLINLKTMFVFGVTSCGWLSGFNGWFYRFKVVRRAMRQLELLRVFVTFFSKVLSISAENNIMYSHRQSTKTNVAAQ